MKNYTTLLFIICIFPVFAYIPEINLNSVENKVFSQNGEDGIIHFLCSVLSPPNYYVEFGVESGVECNTRFLREACQWDGLMMDGRYANPEINLHKEFITKENINELFEKYSVPNEFGLLSIDIDYNDFYIWNELDPKYRPYIVVIEYNASHLPTEDKVVIYSPDACWDQTNYFGASILAYVKLGNAKGYSLVCAEKRGVNLFFIRNDLIRNLPIQFHHINDPVTLYQSPKYGFGPRGGHVQDPLFRPYLSSDEILLNFAY